MDARLVNVEFLPAGKTLRVERGTVVAGALLAAGLKSGMPCGGRGRCGKCRVVFKSGVPEPTPAETDRLTKTELDGGWRLGCTATINQDAVIYIPNGSGAAKILTHGTRRRVLASPSIRKKHITVEAPSTADLRSDLERVLGSLGIEKSPQNIELPFLRHLAARLRESNFSVTAILADGELVDIEPGNTESACYGAAFDIGTTTLAAYLIDLATGDEVATASAVNPQAGVGDDVISRISYSTSRTDGLANLQSLVLQEMNSLIKKLSDAAQISSSHIYEVSVVGNTCMTHLFLGVDPASLAQAPYVPVVRQMTALSAGELGMGINPAGRVHVLPAIAGYVGADTVGVVLASSMYNNEELTLAVDIGTNGEIVLGNKNRMLACSAAAGPAFEGAHIYCGMGAVAGAVDAVWLDEDGLGFSTIEGKSPAGICGSGLLDAVVCMLKSGVVDEGGRIADPEELPQEYAFLKDSLRMGGNGREFILVAKEKSATGEPIIITQRDIREVQLAKGAIAAGIYTLMGRMGVSAEDLDKVILAGAFGNYVRKESALGVGLIPNVPLHKLHSVGNAAGEGAKLALISKDMRGDAARISNEIEYVELTTDAEFQQRFADALIFG
ncbi:MAG: ASKHA domain-containing protein [Armatimonadota bacterium]